MPREKSQHDCTRKLGKRMGKIQWDRAFLFMAGVAFTILSFILILRESFTGSTAAFTSSIVLFFFYHISKFKKWKGFGIEAEFWEETKKEAEELLERLKSIVYIYTREIITRKAQHGRFISRLDWKGTWELYDTLVKKHDDLGQDIDFGNLREYLDRLFIRDMVAPYATTINQIVSKGKTAAERKIDLHLKSNEIDETEFQIKQKKLERISHAFPEYEKRAESGNLANEVLDWAQTAEKLLHEIFEVDIEIPQSAVKKLEEISDLYKNRPFEITEELILMANG
ncbi:hypothetical protein [Mangrovicoccus ximenensis]|uniref:hypothetical protein n=1 Tax=Mangrovicoccus ximenensis TaxID=1911570 RepID=UPI00137527A1|nr:hypothetical protein [Mangrovicoccus ximenensis]